MVKHEGGGKFQTEAAAQLVAQLHSAQAVQACLHQRLVSRHLGAQHACGDALQLCEQGLQAGTATAGEVLHLIIL